jgi:hypothetical protein
VRTRGVERLVTIEQRDIFTLDLGKRPTVVTLYLLPRLSARLLPQLRKLPPDARVISVAHRMSDIKPDEHIVVDTALGEFDVYLWKAEALRGQVPQSASEVSSAAWDRVPASSPRHGFRLAHRSPVRVLLKLPHHASGMGGQRQRGEV